MPLLSNRSWYIEKYEEEISAWNSSLCRIFSGRDSLRGIFSSKEICMKGWNQNLLLLVMYYHHFVKYALLQNYLGQENGNWENISQISEQLVD